MPVVSAVDARVVCLLNIMIREFSSFLLSNDCAGSSVKYLLASKIVGVAHERHVRTQARQDDDKRSQCRASLCLIHTSLQESVGKFFSVCSVSPWWILFLRNFNTETRRSRSLHGEIRLFRQGP